MARTGAGRGLLSGPGAVVIAAGMLAGLAACSANAAATAGASCGMVRTGANVPARVQVVKGPVDCAAALRVELSYAARIRTGDVRGNGGGAPVTVDGWTCQGYPTPQVLSTGAVSECHTARAEVVAVLAAESVGA